MMSYRTFMNVVTAPVRWWHRFLNILEALFLALPGRLWAKAYLAMYTLPIPRAIRRPVYRWWAWHNEADLSEAELPVEEYRDLQEIFTRRLKPGTHHIDRSGGRTAFVSPIDGDLVSYQVLHEDEEREQEEEGFRQPGEDEEDEGQGRAQQPQQQSAGQDTGEAAGRDETQGQARTGRGTQRRPPEAYRRVPSPDLEAENLGKIVGKRGLGLEVREPPREKRKQGGRYPNLLVYLKGVPYRMHDLLTVPTPPPKPGYALHYLVMYLSPSQYHHFHSPVDWTITHRVRVPGQVGPTQPSWSRPCPSWIWTNERVVLHGHWAHGYFAFVAIGASADVAQINLIFEPELRTNVVRDMYWSWGILSGKRPAHATTEDALLVPRAVSASMGTGTAMGTGTGTASSGTGSEQARRSSSPGPPQAAGKKGLTAQRWRKPVGTADHDSSPSHGLNVKEYLPPVRMSRGSELGWFSMGSGLAVVFEAPEDYSLDTNDICPPGTYLRVGTRMDKH